MKCYRRLKLYSFVFGVLLFSLFLAGSRFLSSSVYADSLLNATVDRTLIYTSGAGNSPVLSNQSFYQSFSVLQNVELVGAANPFVAVQGFAVKVPNGSWGDSSYRSNIITVTIALRQVSNSSNQNTLRSSPPVATLYDKNNNLVFGQCDDGVIKDSGTTSHRMDWTCIFRMPDYSAGHNLTWSVGRAVATNSGYPTSSLPFVGLYNTLFTTVSRNGNALYVSSDVQVESTNDISTAILEQQTGIMNQQLGAQQEANRLQQEQNDFLTDNTPPSADTSALADSAGWLPAGPVDSILTIPITFLNGIIGALGSDNCTPVSLPLPFVSGNINLPCMRPILNQMGFLTIYNIVGGIVGMFIIWETLKWLYEFVDKTLSLREDNYYNHFWGGL